MSTATPTAPVSARHDLGFGGILHSEWIKLRSLRSTWWTYAALVVMTVGIGTQMSFSTSFAWLDGGMPQPGVQAAGVIAITAGTDISVLLMSVLGVLVVAGEYSTGMIRSSFTAVPRRVPVLLAKALVLAVITFVVGAVAVAITIPISLGVLAGNDVHVRVDDPHYWRGAIASVAYLVLIGLVAFGIGAVIRNVVGGIAVALGFVLVLPIALGLVAGGLGEQVWLHNITRLLPFNLGRALHTHPGYDDFASLGSGVQPHEGLWVLEPWQGAVGLAAWVVVLFTVAIIAVRRRDA